MNSYSLSKIIEYKRCLVCNREFALSEDQKNCPSDGSLLTAVIKDPLIGITLGEKYEITSLIGTGGWSRVYKAKHLHLDRLVAIKVLDEALVGDPLRLSRFETEAKASNVLVHPNIVSVYDYGVLPQPFIVMEYVQGETLDQKIKQDGALPWQEVMSIFCKLCEAMSYAHKMDLIHRDLTPRNIMLAQVTGEVKLLDFGLANVGGQELTRTGEIIGSPPYMSPEQCQGQKLDARSDVYSLGCVMYTALTDQSPFEGQTAVESMYKHMGTVPPSIEHVRPDLSFPKGLSSVVAKTIAKDKDERYPSMDKLLEDLRKVSSGSIHGIAPIKLPSYKRTINRLARVSMLGIVAFVGLFIFSQFLEYQICGRFFNPIAGPTFTINRQTIPLLFKFR